jgi:hypothetical protein
MTSSKPVQEKERARKLMHRLDQSWASNKGLRLSREDCEELRSLLAAYASEARREEKSEEK